MKPSNEAELADIVAGADGPLAIQGGGTRGIDLPGKVLSLAGLSGIELYEPGALTVVAAAGTPVAEIETALAAENQRLAFEPMDHRGLLGRTGTPTIGGVVAANVSGPRRIQVGACRDFLLGVRYVDGQGTPIKNGGRVMKNVTGYDLVKLMAGSWGTLGVLSQVSLKVLPRSDTQSTLAIAGLDPVGAVDAMAAALGSPFEVSGAAHDPAGRDGQPVTLVRIEGFESSVDYRAGRLADLLGRFGPVDRIGAEDTATLWRDIRDVGRFHAADGDVWKLSVKPSDAPDLIARIAPKDWLCDWGGGLIWALMPSGTDLRQRAGDFDGHATLIRADVATRERLGRFHPEAPALAALSRGIRQRFDPRGLFNTGLMDSRIEA